MNNELKIYHKFWLCEVGRSNIDDKIVPTFIHGSKYDPINTGFGIETIFDTEKDAIEYVKTNEMIGDFLILPIMQISYF